MTKKSIISAIIVAIILIAIALLYSKSPTPIVSNEVNTNTINNNSTTTNIVNDVNKDLNQVDSTNFKQDFENIDKSINDL